MGVQPVWTSCCTVATPITDWILIQYPPTTPITDSVSKTLPPLSIVFKARSLPGRDKTNGSISRLILVTEQTYATYTPSTSYHTLYQTGTKPIGNVSPTTHSGYGANLACRRTGRTGVGGIRSLPERDEPIEHTPTTQPGFGAELFNQYPVTSKPHPLPTHHRATHLTKQGQNQLGIRPTTQSGKEQSIPITFLTTLFTEQGLTNWETNPRLSPVMEQTIPNNIQCQSSNTLRQTHFVPLLSHTPFSHTPKEPRRFFHSSQIPNKDIR